MARRLRTFVHVDGTAYGPDDEVPPEVADRIGEHAWQTGDTDEGDAGEPGPVGYTDPQVRAAADQAPPRTGRGSGVDAWRAFAEQHDVDVPADASREDIIAACEQAGVIEREG